jgi:phospholipid transport system transporter-binding protein
MFAPTQNLTMQSASTALAAGLAAVAGGQTEMDLGQLTAVDSSAVATLLAWQRAALVAGRSLSFTNPPASLLSLAKLYDLDALLHLTPRHQG